MDVGMHQAEQEEQKKLYSFYNQKSARKRYHPFFFNNANTPNANTTTKALNELSMYEN